MKKWHKIVMIIALLGIIGSAIGYYMYQKPVKNFAESKADYTLNSVTLFNEFSANQNESIAKYVTSNKTIQTDGTIHEVKKNDDGTFTIFLKMAEEDNYVSCTLSMEESQKLNKDEYPVGKNITIKGQCSGIQELIGKEVIMIRCGIVK